MPRSPRATLPGSLSSLSSLLQQRWLPALLILACATSFAQQPAPNSDASSGDAGNGFARIDHDEAGEAGEARALQVAIVRYRARSDVGPDIDVDLIGAVHIGESGYYQSLNTRFREYDSLLYELVAPEGTIPESNAESGGFMSGLQRWTTSALDMSFQLDEIDYGAVNFVHADLTPEQFAAQMAARDESLYVYFWRVMYASMHQAGKDPLGLRANGALIEAASDGDFSAKRLLAAELARGDAITPVFEGPNGSALIAARNERAIEVLRERMADGDRRLAIFYGVAHLPDFDQRLHDMGFVETGREWVDAWFL